MKKIILPIIGIALLFLCTTCRKEHVAPINQLVKDLFCFKTGSEWTYYDSISQTTQKMVITIYKEEKRAPQPKGNKKTYDYQEYIEMNGFFLRKFIISIGALGKEEEYDNTAGFWGDYVSVTLPLQFRYDKDKCFNCSVKCLAEYTVSDIVYKNVYIFFMKDLKYDDKDIEYYVAKHIGLIRIKQDGGFDWILIDKNVQQ